ncbi:MAG: DUF4189 domain-containing protein [Vicinamibacterales bacterium]
MLNAKQMLALAIAATVGAIALSAHAAPPARAGRGGYHGAIAYHAPTNAIGLSFDFKATREANVAALNQCGHPECTIVATTRNGCVALGRENGKLFHAAGATRDEAEAKARGRCKVTTGKSSCDILAWTCTK